MMFDDIEDYEPNFQISQPDDVLATKNDVIDDTLNELSLLPIWRSMVDTSIPLEMFSDALKELYLSGFSMDIKV